MNAQVSLGMACAKIARSLSFTTHSTLIEVLEQGSLFSDILSENFRHQLETYSILSCYEGIGDVLTQIGTIVYQQRLILLI